MVVVVVVLRRRCAISSWRKTAVEAEVGVGVGMGMGVVPLSPVPKGIYPERPRTRGVMESKKDHHT